MIVINNLEIQNNSTELLLDVQTEIGSTITSVILWNQDTFKDYTQGINLTSKLVQTSNLESFVVTTTELNIQSFDGIWFVEILDDYIPINNCDEFTDPAIGITYNLLPYYKCLLETFYDSQKNVCNNCLDIVIDNKVLTTSLLLDIIEKSIESGFYFEGIENYKKLVKICSLKKCKNCQTIECKSCSKFKQTEENVE